MHVVRPSRRGAIAARAIEQAGLADRVSTATGDFFADPLPGTDVITMGLILHTGTLSGSASSSGRPTRPCLRVARSSPSRTLIDDERRENVFGLMMSLNMLIEFGDAFDSTGADLRGWCEEAGFRRFEGIPLAGPGSAGIAYK